MDLKKSRVPLKWDNLFYFTNKTIVNFDKIYFNLNEFDIATTLDFIWS